MSNNAFPPIIPEGYWMNSHLSIARHYGQLQLDGHLYIIVDKTGRDIFELSAIASREGKDKAIEPGEPCDLCREDWIKSYRALGRDKIIEFVQQGKTLAEVKKIIKEQKEIIEKEKK